MAEEGAELGIGNASHWLLCEVEAGRSQDFPAFAFVLHFPYFTASLQNEAAVCDAAKASGIVRMSGACRYPLDFPCLFSIHSRRACVNSYAFDQKTS